MVLCADHIIKELCMASVDDEIIKFPFFCDTGKCQSCIARCRHNRMGLDILCIFIFAVTDCPLQRIKKKILIKIVCCSKDQLPLLAVTTFPDHKRKRFGEWITGETEAVIFQWEKSFWRRHKKNLLYGCIQMI